MFAKYILMVIVSSLVAYVCAVAIRNELVTESLGLFFCVSIPVLGVLIVRECIALPQKSRMKADDNDPKVQLFYLSVTVFLATLGSIVISVLEGNWVAITGTIALCEFYSIVMLKALKAVRLSLTNKNEG